MKDKRFAGDDHTFITARKLLIVLAQFNNQNWNYPFTYPIKGIRDAGMYLIKYGLAIEEPVTETIKYLAITKRGALEVFEDIL